MIINRSSWVGSKHKRTVISRDKLASLIVGPGSGRVLVYDVDSKALTQHEVIAVERICRNGNVLKTRVTIVTRSESCTGYHTEVIVR